MTHEIEQTEGVSLFTGRTPAWHQLGQIKPDLDIAAAMDEAALGGWNVRTTPLVVQAEGVALKVRNQQAVLRDNPISGNVEALATVGSRFVPTSNEEMAGFGEALLHAAHGLDKVVKVDAAGSIRSGRRVFFLLYLDGMDVVAVNDHVKPYLLVSQGHDGSLALTAQATTIRVVCANTLAAALGHSTEPKYTIRHSGQDLEQYQFEAMQTLRLLDTATSALRSKMEAWAAVPVSNKQFLTYVRKFVFPSPPRDVGVRAHKARERNVGLVWDYWLSETQQTTPNTAWAAVNTLIEWKDWGGVKKAKSAESRALAQIGQSSATWKAQQARSLAGFLDMPELVLR